jgi:peptidoglycan hydrolase FlgJ
MTDIAAIKIQNPIAVDKAKIQAARADKAAQDFEAVYISEMLKPMIETVEVDENFGGGKGEEVFRGLLTQELGKSISQQGGFGLAAQVRAELLKIQQSHTETE